MIRDYAATAHCYALYFSKKGFNYFDANPINFTWNAANQVNISRKRFSLFAHAAMIGFGDVA